MPGHSIPIILTRLLRLRSSTDPRPNPYLTLEILRNVFDLVYMGGGGTGAPASPL